MTLFGRDVRRCGIGGILASRLRRGGRLASLRGQLGIGRRVQCLMLLAGDLAGIGPPKTLELEMIAYGVIEQSHCAPKPYLDGTISICNYTFWLSARSLMRGRGAIAQLGERL